MIKRVKVTKYRLTSEVEGGGISLHIRAVGGTPVVLRIVIRSPARASVTDSRIDIIDEGSESNRQNTEQAHKHPCRYPEQCHCRQGSIGQIASVQDAKMHKSGHWRAARARQQGAPDFRDVSCRLQREACVPHLSAVN